MNEMAQWPSAIIDTFLVRKTTKDNNDAPLRKEARQKGKQHTTERPTWSLFTTETPSRRQHVFKKPTVHQAVPDQSTVITTPPSFETLLTLNLCSVGE